VTCKNFSSLASGAGAARRGSCGNVRRRLSHLMSVLSVMQCHVKCLLPSLYMELKFCRVECV